MKLQTLISYEFRKYFSRFHIVLLIFLLTVNIFFAGYTFHEYFTKDYREYQTKKSELIVLYAEKPEEYDELVKEHEQKVRIYNDELMSINSSGVLPVFENEYIDLPSYNDILLFSQVQKIVSASENHKNRISAIFRDAIFRLEESEENTYLERYYMKFCTRYMEVANIELKPEEIRGWNDFFSYRISSFLLLIALFGILSTTFTSDMKAGMRPVLYVTRYGGKTLHGAKLIFMAGMSAILTLIFTAIPLFFLSISCGLSSLEHPIQMLDILADCPFKITVGQYFVIYLILRTVIFYVLTLLAAVVNQFFNSEKFAFITITIIVVTGFFLEGIEPISPYYFLQKFSVTKITEINILFEKYRGLNIFGYCVDYTLFIYLALALIISILILLAVSQQNDCFHEYSESLRSTSKISQSISLIRTEYFKHFICAKYFLLVLIVVILKSVIFLIYYYPTDSYIENQYKEYIQELEGKITDEKLNMIENEKVYIEKSLSEYEIAKTKFKAGKMDESEFEEYKKRYNYAEYYQYSCKQLCERRDYLVNISKAYPEVEFIYDRGMELYFTSVMDIPLLILILFMASNVFACEYEHGFDKILRTTLRGRHKIFYIKITYSLCTAGILYVIFCLLEMGIINLLYPVIYWNAPIQSMPIFENVIENCTIAEYMIKHQIISLIGYMVCFLFVVAFSVILKNQFKAIFITLFIMLMAFLEGQYPIFPITILNYIEMLSPMYIEQNGISYITCIILSFISIVIAYKKWIGGNKKYVIIS